MGKLFVLLFLSPSLLFALSEQELDSLESSGSKSFSESSWRREIRASLKRNLEVEFSESESKDVVVEASLLDLTNLYYGYDFTLYYSLDKLSKYPSFSFLKKSELSLRGGFFSNFARGSCASLLKHQDKKTNQIKLGSYFRCGLQDIVGGLTSPIYQKENLFVFLNLSLFRLPLSKNSFDFSLINSSSGAVSLFYFLKKGKDWNLALSSSFNLTYNYFKNLTADVDGEFFNEPLRWAWGGRLILQQKLSPYLPLRVSVFSSYDFAFNTYKIYSPECKSKSFSLFLCGSRYQFLSLGGESSWKLYDRLFLSLSVNWRNLIKSSNPLDKKIFVTQPYSFGSHNWYVTNSLSYSF
ncbi:MAG: hypothetical protein GDA46_06280 [Bdellovibrionales bacterium]|nr:hypothetical protein [Bdellovibrionales bacterium]